MNTIHNLASMDWEGKVPPFEGKGSGNSLDNLKTILDIIKDNKDDDSKIILRKCINFTKNIKDGKQYYIASSAFAKNFKVQSETVEFQDGKQKVNNFQIKALERDYPGRDVRAMLKNMSHEDFQYLLQCLYSPPIKMSDDEKNQAVAFLREHNLYNASRIQDTLGLNPDVDEHDYQKFELKDVLHFLNGKDKLNRGELANVIRRATQFVEAMNPRSKDDLFAAAEISRAISDISDSEEQEGFLKDELLNLKKEANNLANKQILDTRKLTALEKFVIAVASFIGKSVEHWYPIDPEVVYESLNNIKDLTIEVPKNRSEAFWTWVSQSSNIKKVILPEDYKQEEFNKIPDGVLVVEKVEKSRTPENISSISDEDL